MNSNLSGLKNLLTRSGQVNSHIPKTQAPPASRKKKGCGEEELGGRGKDEVLVEPSDEQRG